MTAMSDSDSALMIDALLLVMAVECCDDDAETEATARAQLEGALSAAVAVGLVEIERAEQIREVAADLDEETVGSLPADRLEAVDGLVADLFAAARAPEASYRAAGQLEGAVETLVDVGAGSDDDRDRWRSLLDEVEDALEAEFDDDDRAERRGLMLALRMVIAGPWSLDGARVTSIECYDDGVLVRWEETRELPTAVRNLWLEQSHRYLEGMRDELGGVGIADDLGTEYPSNGSQSSWSIQGAHLVANGDARFSAPIPAGARALRIGLRGQWVEIALPAGEGEAI